MSRIILASASPRRRELMQQAGIDCEIVPAAGEESSDAVQPAEFVQELSAHKAREVFQKMVKETASSDVPEPFTVIGADTVVVHRNSILGKPKDRADAKRMIFSLQNDTHSVMTGVTMIARNADGSVRSRTFYEETLVNVCPMTEEEVDKYISTGECDDKAGAYGIQGRFGIYIEGIRGDYNNVVGLPIARLYHELKDMKVL